MDKTILKNFAIDARNQLIEEIQNKAAMIGITEDGITPPLPESTSDLLLFDIQSVDPYMLKGQEIRQYKRLVNELEQREENSDYDTAYETLIEEIAYTWFNRLIAIRFMEVNNYMPNRMRVLSSGIDGVNEPELVTNYLDSGLDFTQEELGQLAEWRLDGSARSMGAMFQFLFIKQANALNENLPELFEKTDDYAELLLTISYNNPEGLLYRLIHEVPAEYFDVETEDGHGQVEIIGWLYQYYNTEKKDEVFKKLNVQKINKNDLPAATQLFTPDWIVQYMVQNSLGRLWIEKLLVEGDTRTEKEIAESFNWKYYIPEAEQETKVKEQLVKIKADRMNLQIEEITFIDPAMGSYHIGVYAFDVFMQLYKSQGYSPRDAAELIVEKNLYGIDIDKRAYQLSYFAILMKARQYSRRILRKNIRPNLYSIIESNPIDRNHLEYLGINIEDKQEWINSKEDIIEILDLFTDAKEYGSILKVDDNYNFEQMKDFVLSIKKDTQVSFETLGIEKTQHDLLTIIFTAKTLSSKYDLVVTNPPYMGRKSLNKKISKFMDKNYKIGKSELYSAFILKSVDMTKRNGFTSMITIHTWMFISSFKQLREYLIKNTNLITLVHTGPATFEELNAFNVLATTFTIRKNEIKDYLSSAIRLVEYNNTKEKLEQYHNYENLYLIKQDDFQIIPGTPFVYWISDKMKNNFKQSESLRHYSRPRQGLATGKNKRFIRYWFEVDYLDFCRTAKSTKEFHKSGKLYAPYNKGGNFRKWYGMNEYVIKFDEANYSLLSKSGNRLPAREYYFKPGLTWSLFGFENFAIRYKPKGFVFDVSGSSMFPGDEILLYILAFLTSKVAFKYLSVLAPTVNFQVGNIGDLPMIIDETIIDQINLLSIENIEISKQEWNDFEESWDFKKHPLINFKKSSLKNNFGDWNKTSKERYSKLKYNEEKINQLFIEVYDVEKDITPEVVDRDIALRIGDRPREIKSFISYAVGCMFGRYSLDEEGLIYAGGDWNDSKYETFKPAEDNVLLITDEDYFEDDIIHRFVEFVEVVYGEETLEENLEFIADSLTGQGNPREKIRNYFMNNFYKDHVQTYQKHPIYWMYDSSAGKTRRNSENGFKALVYMHRYEEDTTGKVRMDYLHKVQRAYEYRIDNLEHQMDLSDNAREKAEAEKEIEKLTKQLKELQDYDEKIGHLALSRIPIDLDDGVRVNYDKVQTDENGKKLKILAKR